MNHKIQRALDAWLAKEGSLDELSGRFKLSDQERQELNELTEVARQVQENPIQASPEFKRRALKNFQRTVQSEESVTKSKVPRLPLWNAKQPKRRYAYLANFAVALSAFVFFFVSVRVVNASGPGDLLYGLDLALERLQLSLINDDQQRLEKLIAIADERLREAENNRVDDDQPDFILSMGFYRDALDQIKNLMNEAINVSTNSYDFQDLQLNNQQDRLELLPRWEVMEVDEIVTGTIDQIKQLQDDVRPPDTNRDNDSPANDSPSIELDLGLGEDGEGLDLQDSLP